VYGRSPVPERFLAHFVLKSSRFLIDFSNIIILQQLNEKNTKS